MYFVVFFFLLMESNFNPNTCIYTTDGVKRSLSRSVTLQKQTVRLNLSPFVIKPSQAWEHSEESECVCVCPADGCCVELRLASCGQDSQLKIWIVSQREGAGRPTSLPAALHWKLSHSIAPEKERGGGGPLTALTLKSLCRIEHFISVCVE